MAEQWHRAERCKSCYYCRYLSDSSKGVGASLGINDNWDGKCCYYGLDTGLQRVGRGETCQCYITIKDFLNADGGKVKEKIKQLLAAGKSTVYIKRTTHIPVEYIEAIAKEEKIEIKHNDMIDDLLASLSVD